MTQASLEVIATSKNADDIETNRLSQEELDELQSLRIKVVSLQTENERLIVQARVCMHSSFFLYKHIRSLVVIIIGCEFCDTGLGLAIL